VGISVFPTLNPQIEPVGKCRCAVDDSSIGKPASPSVSSSGVFTGDRCPAAPIGRYDSAAASSAPLLHVAN